MIPTVGFNMRKITKGNVTIKVGAEEGGSLRNRGIRAGCVWRGLGGRRVWLPACC